MSRLGTVFLKNFSFLTNGNLYLNRIQSDFSPVISTIKTDVVQKLKELGIPERPKKPGSSYIIFLKEIHPRILKENPNSNKSQIFIKCGELWRSLNTEARAKYDQIFKDLQRKYDSDLLNFQESLSEDQKKALEVFAEAKKKDKKDRKKRKELIQLKKPKKPLNAYAIFLTEMSKTRNMPIKTLLSEIGEEWKNLTDKDKGVYEIKARNARAEYEKQMKIWEDKMLLEGRRELLRKKVEVEPKKQSRILTYKAEEDH